MAVKPLKQPKNDSANKARNLPSVDNTQLAQDLGSRYTSSKDYFNKKRTNWVDNEKLFNAVRADNTTDTGLITDGSLTTLIIERAARNSAQLQTGRVKELGNTTSAAATIVDLIYQYEIVPNANSGNPFLTKLFQTDMGADIYGTYPVMYGLNVTESCAYADFWLIKPQLYYPQPAKSTPFDMGWAQVETQVSVSQLKSILNNDSTTWDKKEIQKIITQVNNGKIETPNNDADTTTYGERNDYDTTQTKGKGDFASITLRTEYQSGESGKWITYAPFYDNEILRNTPNRHKNGKIPIVHRVSIPQFDQLYGISTMDRGKPIQKTIDSFSNLGYQNALLNVFPIIKVKTGSVINSTLEFKPGATWRMEDLNAVQPYTTGNLSQEYFQQSISSLRAILINQNGTTSTDITAQGASDQTFGRTKRAIDERSQKQNARDSLDLRMRDQFYSELASGLIDVKLNCATKPVQINLDKERVKKLLDDKDTADLIDVDKKTWTVSIKLGPLKNGKYKYEVDPGTSVEADDATEHQRLTEIISTLNGSPALIQMAQQEGYEFSAGKLLQNYIGSSNTKDQEEIIRKKTDEELAAEQEQMGQQQAVQGQEQPQDEQMVQGQPEMAHEDMQLHPFVQAIANDPQGALQQFRGGM